MNSQPFDRTGPRADATRNTIKTVGGAGGVARQRTSGGNRMSLNKSTQRRAVLMAGSSVIAAVAFLGVSLSATTAYAANECGTNPNTNLSAPDVINCPSPPTTYATGISHTSNGDLTVNVAAGVISFGTGGFVTTAGNLNDNLTVKAPATDLSSSTTTGTRAPVVIDVLSQNGDVTVQTSHNVAGAGGFVQYGIRARSSLAGDVTVTSSGGNITTGTSSSNPGIAGIFASSNGGNVSIDKTAGSITGRLYGIQARATGAGTISLDIGGNVTAGQLASSGSIAAIDAISDLGAIEMDLRGNVNGGATPGAVGIITQSNGAVTVNLTNANLTAVSVGGVPRGLAMRASGAGSVELNLAHTGAVVHELDLRGMTGGLDFSALGGPTAVNIGENATWEVTTNSTFGVGDDTVTIADGGYLFLANLRTSISSNTVAQDRYVLEFGAGENAIVNSGKVIVGVDARGVGGAGPDGGLQDPRAYEGELVLSNLGTFENAGDIYLGAFEYWDNATFDGVRTIKGTDRWIDDILVMQGADYTGAPGSRLLLDVLLNNTDQQGCDPALRNSDGDMPGADCIDLRGGTASGQTLVTITDALPGDRGAYAPDGIVIVDVSGGSAEAGAFVLDPATPGYVLAGAGHIDKGLFAFTIGYDEATQQFKVYGVESSASQQFAILGSAANELWRTTAGAWHEYRQTGLLGADRGPGVGGGVWMRLGGSSTERDIHDSVEAGTSILEFDNSYSQRNLSLTAGIDLAMGGIGDTAWVIGAMAGYARGELEFDASSNTGNLEGAHAGVYGSLTAGALYVDAVLNGTWLQVDDDVPNMNLTPAGTLMSTTAHSLGAQVEAGWRLMVGSLGVEPLASVSYVTTSTEALNVPAADPSRFGGDVEFQDAKSVRGGVGVRFSMLDVVPAFAPVGFSVTAKALQESDGVSAASIRNVGPNTPTVSDTLDGTFSEIGGAITFSNEAGSAGGFLNVGGVFADDYENVGASVGLRYQW